MLQERYHMIYEVGLIQNLKDGMSAVLMTI